MNRAQSVREFLFHAEFYPSQHLHNRSLSKHNFFFHMGGVGFLHSFDLCGGLSVKREKGEKSILSTEKNRDTSFSH